MASAARLPMPRSWDHLQQRGYVIRENKRLIPTETGILVNDMITEHFPNIVDIGFTASMEEDLDRIAAGEQPWVETSASSTDPFAAGEAG